MEPISQFATMPGSRIFFEVDGVDQAAEARGCAAAEKFLSNAELTPYAAFVAVKILGREWHDAKEHPDGLQNAEYWSQLRRMGMLWKQAEEVALQVATAGLPDEDYRYYFYFACDDYQPAESDLHKVTYFKGRPQMFADIWAAVN